MARSWYIIHTYATREKSIEQEIRSLVDKGFIDSSVLLDVKIPVEEVVDIKNGKKRSSEKKILPNYILLEMDLPDSGWKNVCSAIRSIKGVTGFVGTPANAKPSPISAEEARSILQRTGDVKGGKAPRVAHSFVAGESVKITGGSFESFNGTIEKVDLERGKLRVMVEIFGRKTPVEVDLVQVEKIV